MKDFIIPWDDDRDLGHACAGGWAPVSLVIDGVEGDGAGGHIGDAGPPRWLGSRCRSSCATDSVEAFGSCRLCVVEIEGRRVPAGVVHHACRAGDGGGGRKPRWVKKGPAKG